MVTYKKFKRSYWLPICALILSCAPMDQRRNEVISQLITESDYPSEIILAGYGPSTSSFSQGLTIIGERMQNAFGDDLTVRYVYNLLDLGYPAANAQIGLIDKDALTLGYVTMHVGVPALEVAALPFLFSDSNAARAAMDGALGRAAIDSIEANSNLKVLGFYENGFRHVSNAIRPVDSPEDMTGLKIRTLAIETRPLELMGAAPLVTSLPDVIPGLASGELDGQENPFENVVTYGMYNYQKYYTKTYHSYLSRPVFVNRETFNSWPEDFRNEFQAAVNEAIELQRGLHDQAEIDAEEVIRESGGEIIDLTPEQRQLFVESVQPMYQEAQAKYDQDLLELVGL